MIPARRLFFALGLVSPVIVGAIVVPWLFFLALSLDLLLLLLAFIDARRAAGTKLVIQRLPSTLLAQGRPAELAVLVSNPAPHEILLRLRDGLHPSLADFPPSTEIRLAPESSWRWSLPVRPRLRGEFKLLPLTLRLRGPLGLAWAQREIDEDFGVLVYPQIRWGGEVGRLLKMAQQHQLGQLSWRRRGATGESYALREYLPGDPMRRIHWKAAARHGRLIVREDSLERGNSIFILLDAARAMAAPASPMKTKFDEALAAALVISRVASARHDRTTILAFSDRIERVVGIRPGRDGLKLAYRRLYDLQARLVEPAFDLAAARLLDMEHRRGVVMILTSMADLVALEQLEETLFRLRRRHRVLLVNLEDPELERLALASPESEEEAFAKASALKILIANRKAARKFQVHGIRIMSTSASRFAAVAVSGYLDALVADPGSRRASSARRVRL